MKRDHYRVKKWSNYVAAHGRGKVGGADCNRGLLCGCLSDTPTSKVPIVE